jgi:hypothetical protein
MRAKKSPSKKQKGILEGNFLALVLNHASQPQVSLATTQT